MSCDQDLSAQLAIDEYVYISDANDTQSEANTYSSSLVDEDGGALLTQNGSIVIYSNDDLELQSTNSLTPTASLSSNHAPSIAILTDGAPSVFDLEQRLEDRFAKLTFREKYQALSFVGEFEDIASDASPKTETETEILTQTDAGKISNIDDISEDGGSKPSLEDWQALCKAVGVVDNLMPSSITQCKKTLKNCNANLADLSTALRAGTVAQTFPSVAALARYSKRESKVASKTVVKKNPLLKVMLRELFRGAKGHVCQGKK